MCFSGLSSADGGNGTLRDQRPLKRRHDGDEDESVSPNKKLVISRRSSTSLNEMMQCTVTSASLVQNLRSTPATRPASICHV